MSDFNLRKFLSENKLTRYSQLVTESPVPASIDPELEEYGDMEEGEEIIGDEYEANEEEVVEEKEGRNLMQYGSVDEMIKEIEAEANKAALEMKIDEVRKSCKRLEEELHSLEESEHAHMISSSKMNKMRKDERKLKKVHEKYLDEYAKKYGE